MRRNRLSTLSLAILLAWAGSPASAAEGVVVIGNANLRRLDPATLARIYTGRVIDVDGVAVTAVNAQSGSPVRNRFLQAFLSQDEEKYTAYWTVRRYIGKGASPRELSRSTDVIAFVNATPGAIGYIDPDDVQPGMNVLLRIPP